jgi:hypothetical protein
MFSYAAYRRYRRYRRWRRRRRLAILLIAITVAAVATQHLAAHPRTASHGHTPTSVATAPARKSPSHASAAPQARNSVSPSVSWTDFHGIQLPVSATAGPHHRHNGLARGFADTPLGAVLAAVNIVVRTAAQWGPPVYRPTINHQLTGPGAAALLATDNSDYAAMRAAAHVAPGQPAGRGHAAETAYRLAAYTPAGATADIVTEGPASNGTTVIAVTRIRLVWQRRDWRVIAPPGGTWASSASTASALRGYTVFPNEG